MLPTGTLAQEESAVEACSSSELKPATPRSVPASCKPVEEALASETGTMKALEQKRPREQWTNSETALFFVGLKDIGRDFERIASKIPSKNKEQVRHFYYRVLKKIQKLLAPIGHSFDNHFDEVYAMLCFWQLKKPHQKNGDSSKHTIHDEKYSKKFCSTLHQLITEGIAYTKNGKRHRTVKLSSSIVKGIKKPPTYDQKHESEEESFSQSKSPGKGKKCNLGLKSEPKPPSVCVGCNTDPYRVRIDEAFVFSLSMDDIAKLKILIPMREQDPFHQRQAVGVSDKLTLQLKPRTEMLAYSLQQKGIEPRILLTFKATKSLSAILEYFAKKWTDKSNGRMQPVRLYPPSESSLSPNFCGWGMENALGLTARDIFISVGMPAIFCLYYDWDQLESASSPPSGVSLPTGNLSNYSTPLEKYDPPDSTQTLPSNPPLNDLEPSISSASFQEDNISRQKSFSSPENAFLLRNQSSSGSTLQPNESTLVTTASNNQGVLEKKPFYHGSGMPPPERQTGLSDAKASSHPSTNWLTLGNSVDISCDGFSSNFFGEKSSIEGYTQFRDPPKSNFTKMFNPEKINQDTSTLIENSKPEENPLPNWMIPSQTKPANERASCSTDFLLSSIMKEQGNESVKNNFPELHLNSNDVVNFPSFMSPGGNSTCHTQTNPKPSNIDLKITLKQQITKPIESIKRNVLGDSGSTYTIGSVGSFSLAAPNQTTKTTLTGAQKRSPSEFLLGPAFKKQSICSQPDQ